MRMPIAVILFLLIAPVTLAQTPRVDLHGDSLPMHAVARLGSIRLCYADNVRAIGQSGDGKIFAVTTTDDRKAVAEFVDADTGKRIARWILWHDEERDGWTVTDLHFTPDNKHVICSYRDTLELRELATGKLVRKYGPKGHGSSIAVSPDGKLLAAQVADGFETATRLWEVDTGRALKAFAGPGAWTRLQFTPDGKQLLSFSRLPDRGKLGEPIGFSSSGPASCRVWDVESRKLLHERAFEALDGEIAFRPDGRNIAVQQENDRDKIEILNLASARTQVIIKAKASHFCFSPDGKSILTLTDVIRQWNAATGRLERQFEGHLPPMVRILGFSSDGKRLSLALGSANGSDCMIRQWDMVTGAPTFADGGHQDAITCVAWAPAGDFIASGSVDKTVRVWNAHTGRQIQVLRCNDAVTAVAWSPDGMTLASSTVADNYLWNVATGKVSAALRGAQGPLHSLAFSADGQTLVGRCKSAPFETCIWEPARSLLARACYKCDESARGSFGMVSQDARWTLTMMRGNIDGYDTVQMMLSECATNKPLLNTVAAPVNLTTLHSICHAAAISHDGRTIVAGLASQDDARAWCVDYRFFDRITGDELLTIKGGFATTISFSPDNRMVAAGHGGHVGRGYYNDSTISLRSCLDGAELASLEGHGGIVRAVAFSPDGARLASASADHTLLVWDVTPFRKPATCAPATG
ncbi:MAG TPA: WD40 repeat domain-containing protein, partial [Gemmataceae bacterium]|nr:WD40 repeat domain-containing protein [Gemmataceae bacterium]